MADCDNLFKEFDTNLQVPMKKRNDIKTSDSKLREKIRIYFAENHPGYNPTFYQQGSSKTKSRIRTKDDTCDLDDGVYFISNPDGVTGKILQGWVKNAVDGTTDATPSHRKKCITVDYKAKYNIDLPVFIFDKNEDAHPMLAIKDEDFREDDPKEFLVEFNRVKDKDGQLIRITKYLKAWCDFKREKMPSGLSMTVLAMNFLQKNSRDDVSLKYTLIAIENELKKPNRFRCDMPTTPNDNLFESYDDARKTNFMNNLSSFISDAKKAVDEEKNHLEASHLWQKHFGDTYFPEGEDKDEVSTSAKTLSFVIGSSKPHAS